jgi:hypothetical protein
LAVDVLVAVLGSSCSRSRRWDAPPAEACVKDEPARRPKILDFSHPPAGPILRGIHFDHETGGVLKLHPGERVGNGRTLLWLLAGFA